MKGAVNSIHPSTWPGKPRKGFLILDQIAVLECTVYSQEKYMSHIPVSQACQLNFLPVKTMCRNFKKY
jgi:hypothetical protein